MLLRLTPLIYRKRSSLQRPRKQIAPPTPAALNLVAAELLPESVVLTFDRAINIAALDGSAVFVDDHESDTLYQGTSQAALLDPMMVEITTVGIGQSSNNGVRLSASAGSGIVAIDDGGTWGGVSELELPFP